MYEFVFSIIGLQNLLTKIFEDFNTSELTAIIYPGVDFKIVIEDVSKMVFVLHC